MSPAISVGHAAQISLLAILFYAGWTITYNRYLHPLRSYRGPLLSTISRIPYIIAYTQGRLHLYVHALHDRYGDVVRIAPDELSYPWKDIYVRSSNFAKDMRFYQSSKKAASIVVAPEVIHRRQKKAILRAFSDSALRDHERVLLPYVDVLIEKLGAAELFGKPLGCLEEASYHPWVEVLFGTVKAWAFLAIPTFFSSAAMLLKPLVLFLCRDSLGHRDTKYRALSGHIPKGDEQKKPVFMAHVQSSSGNNPETVLLQDEMLPNYSFLMMAGSETTATLLSGCTFYLLKHPHSYQRLTSEVRQCFSAPTEIVLSSLAVLPYLHSVITETLRLYPPVPLGMPRTTPAGGAMISGRYVPEKTTVSVPSWVTSRSPSKFSSPDQFIPERWLDDPPCLNDNKAAMQPFSLGLRGCPGKSMAYMEAGLILARILWSFDLQFRQGVIGGMIIGRF
ncbi:cytochrome P450 monooxygenase [Penicillium cosmopolitanum]|uniref:Cytochrome P450 monooxygenase n=1 Tax=Penicillium cosmopolitanum TaxID=1131564 RepID=A0A9W9W4E4_9EURO|nr:cytochrome P450 monooxygenase [Penicillium cosmopolitanum]KAJ5398337.1 cytochrome P450 monooxygenase [Penicillium cosmopolitanum]